jgi:hypothetical protein
MLNPNQKYGIASALAADNLDNVIANLNKLPFPDLISEGVKFAKHLNQFFKKRDGFIPAAVLELLK